LCFFSPLIFNLNSQHFGFLQGWVGNITLSRSTLVLHLPNVPLSGIILWPRHPHGGPVPPKQGGARALCTVLLYRDMTCALFGLRLCVNKDCKALLYEFAENPDYVLPFPPLLFFFLYKKEPNNVAPSLDTGSNGPQPQLLFTGSLSHPLPWRLFLSFSPLSLYPRTPIPIFLLTSLPSPNLKLYTEPTPVPFPFRTSHPPKSPSFSDLPLHSLFLSSRIPRNLGFFQSSPWS